MSSSAQAQQQQASNSNLLSSPSSSSSSATSSNASSLIKLDELSSFGATKQNRLPALIKLNPLADQTNAMQQQQQQQLIQEQQQQQQQAAEAANSMPNFSESQLDKMTTVVGQQQQQQQHADSLPANLQQRQQGQLQANKENSGAQEAIRPRLDDGQRADESSDDFQVVEMDEGADHDQGATLMGPSLPAANEAPAPTDSLAPSKSTETTIEVNKQQQQQQQHLTSDALQNLDAKSLSAQLQSTNLSNPYASHLGDSLIEMIINLRNENQNLVRALETNNEYVKERLSEFKKCQEDSKKREAAYAMEKAEHEHQIRKLQRQNSVLSERLKSMEAKLKDMKLEVSESLNAANSSKTSSLRNGDDNNLYPQLGATADESFSNSALLDATSSANANNHNAVTMQMDATSGELYNNHNNNIGSNEDEQDDSDSDSDDSADDDDDDDDDLNDVGRAMDDTAMDPAASSQANLAQRVGGMSKEELSKRFDANKAQFYSLDDPMKQCDQLEQQLNDIGKRDYEICLLQQQLNIYRQDFRLERMAKLEARIQIEKLKNDIDRLCLERVQEHDREQERIRGGRGKRGPAAGSHPNASSPSSSSAHVRFGTTSNDGGASAFIGKLGHHLGRKAAKSAAKAAKYAAKRAHLEEKAAAAMARAASKAAASSHFSYSQSNQTAQKQQQHMATDQQQPQQPQQSGAEYPHHRGHHHHRGHQRHHSHHQRAPRTGIRSEVVNDLLSTANKAMLTGYKMASTHVNLALDKLNQYEQQQANNLDPNNRTTIQQTKAVSSSSAAGSINPSAPPMEPPSID